MKSNLIIPKTPKGFLILTILILLLTVGFVLAFSVDNILLKVAIKQGENVSKIIKITNTDSQASFKIESTGLGNLLFIEDKEFTLKPNEVKTLILNFSSQAYEPGIYVGELIVKSREEKKIPIIVEIETKEVLFDTNLNVPLIYENIYPGEKFIADVTVFNLEKIGMKTVEMNYFIKDFLGNTITSETENLAVETSALVTKTISLPKNIKSGDYVFITLTKYQNSVGTSSHFFRVVETKPFIIEKMEKSSAYIIVIIFFLAIVFFAITFLVVYSIKKKDELFLELEKQHQREMMLQFKLLEEAKKAELKRLRGKKRTKKREEFRKVRRERGRELRKKYKEREKELKKLKKLGLRAQMKRKIKQWEKEGYNVSDLKLKLQKPTRKQIEKMIREWKRKGFDISVLGK